MRKNLIMKKILMKTFWKKFRRKKFVMNKILTKKIKHTISFRVFCFLKHNKFSWGGVLLFLELGLKSTELRFWKYNKCFLLIKYKKFLISDLESSISGNIKNLFWWIFFSFCGFGMESATHCSYIYYLTKLVLILNATRDTSL